MKPGGFAVSVLPWFLLGLAGTIWGLSFSVGKILVEGGAAPLGITMYQGILCAVFIGTVVAVKRRPLLPLIMQPRIAGVIVLISFLSFVFPSTAIYFASDHLPAGIVTILVAISPMVTYALSIPLRVDKFHWRRALGLLLGLTAIALIVFPQGNIPGEGTIPWALLVAAAATSYAVQAIVLGTKSVGELGPLRMAFCMYVCGGVLLTPLAWATGSIVALSWPMNETHLLIGALACMSTIGFISFVTVIQKAGSVFGSQVGYIVTVSGVLWGMLIFSERHSVLIWAALLMMLCGLAMVRPVSRDKPNQG